MGRAAWIIFWTMISGQLLAQSPDSLLLKDYQPRSIFNIPESKVTRARFPVIDMHSHPYALTAADLQRWIVSMDSAGIEQTMILTYATGAEFDSLREVYGAFGERFQLWCGFDYTGYNEPGWTEKAIKELERCHSLGAIGVGELGDKGLGLTYSHPTPAYGMHINDPRMQPLLKRCGELGMPVNIHVAEPAWMYEPMDATNDGLMNGFKWRIDQQREGILLHEALIQTLAEALRAIPGTTFIACHFANCSADLSILGSLLDRFPNLYADISARYGETATIPRTIASFYTQYQDRLLFGTDMGSEPEMYEIVFRILETEDEHFYQPAYFNYHWPLYGFGLSDSILKKLYYENAQKILD